MDFLDLIRTSGLSLMLGISASATPVISEVAPPGSALVNGTVGSTAPWVELHNRSQQPYSLAGHFLTDNPDQPRRFRLPDLTIPGKGYQIIFLSGEASNKGSLSSEIHSNFRFRASDRTLLLIAPNGKTVISALYQIPRNPGTSFGLVSTDSEETALFETPTPGMPNGPPLLGLVADPTFNLKRGLYDSPVHIQITSSSPGSTIIYTLNGEVPREGNESNPRIGKAYTTPIQILGTTVVRAKAFLRGHASSRTVTHTYVFPHDVIEQPMMRDSITPENRSLILDSLRSLPSIFLNAQALEEAGSNDATSERVEKPVSVEFVPSDGGEGFQVDAGITLFGGRFTNFKKRNFRLHFRSRYGLSKLQYPLFRGHESGVPAATEFDALDLRSSAQDMTEHGTFLSNRFTDDTLLEMGEIAPHGRFVHLYINGFYWGQYHLRERWNAAMFSSYFGGHEEDYDAIGADNAGTRFQPGDAYNGSDVFWQKSLDLASAPNPFTTLQAYVDFDSLVAFMLIWMSGNGEAEFHSVGSTTHRVPFKFHPKDSDGYLSLPGYRLKDGGPGNIFGQLLDAGGPEFKILLADAINKHFGDQGAFSPNRNIARLNKRINQTALSIYAESARWGYIDTSSFRSFHRDHVERYLSELSDLMIRRFRKARWLPNVQPPAFSRMGGQAQLGFELRMTRGNARSGATDAQIIFTTDGSDPRLPGAVRNESASIYKENGLVIPLDRTSTIKARALDSNGNWSCLTEATFHPGKTPELNDLVISEIHYRPAAPSPEEQQAGYRTRGDFEFLELYNRSNGVIYLSDVVISEGVNFDFSSATIDTLNPGQVVVIAADSNALRHRYGNSIPLAGSFLRGQLNNGGEEIRIIHRKTGKLLHSIEYGDGDPWPSAPDGEGPSLTLVDPKQQPTESPRAWRASTNIGGTPGYLKIR